MADLNNVKTMKEKDSWWKNNISANDDFTKYLTSLKDDKWFNDRYHSFASTIVVPKTEISSFWLKSYNLSNALDLYIIKKNFESFVSVVTGRHIPITILVEGEEASTDGDRIYISDHITKGKIDVSVALALHESSHILYSDFYLFRILAYVKDIFEDKKEADKIFQTEKEKMSKSAILDNKQKKETSLRFLELVYNLTKKDENGTVIEILKHIVNAIEDRRIDNMTFQKNVGYRDYYHKLYDEYFFTDEMKKMLASDETKIANLKNYIFRVNTLFHPDADLHALPELDKIAVMFQKAVNSKNTWEVFQIALDIFDIIWKYATDEERNQKSMKQIFELTIGNGHGEGMTADGKTFKISEKMAKAIQKALEEQANIIEGIDKKLSVSKNMQEQVDKLTSSDITIEDVFNGMTKCVVIKNVNETILKMNEFFGSENSNEEAVNKGFTLGKLLGHKLSLRNDVKKINISRKESGKIHGRLLHEFAHGETKLFKRVLIDKYDDAYIHISIDASGSMSGRKFQNAIQMATAIAVASAQTNNIDVTIDVRTSHENYPYCIMLYNSRKNNLIHLKNTMTRVSSNGITPEGLCFEGIQKIMAENTKHKTSIFINLSDGMPYFHNNEVNYEGRSACEHTHKQVKKFKEHGTEIVSYFIDESKHSTVCENFQIMYGRDSETVDSNDIVTIARTINKKMLVK